MTLLRIPEVAERLGVSRRKVESMLTAGELPRVKVGRATRVDVRDLEAYIARQHPRRSEPVPLTEGQLRAFHALAWQRDRQKGLARGASKAEALAHVSRSARRTIESSSELSSLEAHEALEWLESELRPEEGAAR